MWSLVFRSAWAFIGSGLYLPLCSLHSQGAGGSFLIFENIKGKKKSKGSRLSCCSGPSTPLICLTQGGKGYTCAEGGGFWGPQNEDEGFREEGKTRTHMCKEYLKVTKHLFVHQFIGDSPPCKAFCPPSFIR